MKRNDLNALLFKGSKQRFIFADQLLVVGGVVLDVGISASNSINLFGHLLLKPRDISQSFLLRLHLLAKIFSNSLQLQILYTQVIDITLGPGGERTGSVATDDVDGGSLDEDCLSSYLFFSADTESNCVFNASFTC